MNDPGLSSLRVANASADGTVPINPLRNFIQTPAGEIHVMTIPVWLSAAIGARTSTVLFSAASMEKNIRHHPDLTVEDYAILPSMNGTSADALIIQDRHNACVIVQDHGRRYLVAIKTTNSGESVFVSSFHRIDDDAEVKRKLKRGHQLVPPFEGREVGPPI
jgi:hypothetical protein